MVWDQANTHQYNEALEESQAKQPAPGGEPSLVAAAQKGDLSAFNQLVLAYQDDVFGWVSSLVHDEASADDITQLTFVTAYQKIQTFRGGSLRAWLFSIARNRAIDEMRQYQRHPSVSLDGDARDEDAGDLLSILPAQGPLPEEAVIQAEQAARLWQLLDSLPEAARQVIQLVDVYEMDYQEVSAVLGMPLGTVKSRLARARQKLRELLEEFQG